MGMKMLFFRSTKSPREDNGSYGTLRFINLEIFGQNLHTLVSSPHPYIFFNQDRTSITFVGFSVNKTTGDLIDPTTGGVLEKSIMSPHLYSGLELNAVNFNENYAAWVK